MIERLIFAVDDEPGNLRLVEEILKAEGYEVETFTRAGELLDAAASRSPALILSDVRMPEMSGFELRRAYSDRYSDRLTPFILLSALRETDDIVSGLAHGADDYLTKPIDPKFLVAKVQAILRRQEKLLRPTFRGALEKFPFIKLMQFCEINGFSGVVDFDLVDGKSHVEFRGGEVVTDDRPELDDLLATLCDAAEGTFVVRASPPSFEALRPYAAAAPQHSTDLPMGRLSGVRLGNRLFQVQTEACLAPEPTIFSVVVLDGRSVLKRSRPLPAHRAEAQLAVDQQHRQVEEEVREKLVKLTKSDRSSPDQQSYYELFERGLEAYRRGDYPAALDSWTRARELNPKDKCLDINLRVVTEKVQACGRPGSDSA